MEPCSNGKMSSLISDHAAIPSQTEKLRGIENHSEWQITIKLTMKVMGMWWCFSETAERPRYGGPEQQEFDRKQTLALWYIWNSLTHDVQKLLLRGEWTEKQSPRQTMIAIANAVMPSMTLQQVVSDFPKLGFGKLSSIDEFLE